jgi:hypothetical protein
MRRDAATGAYLAGRRRRLAAMRPSATRLGARRREKERSVAPGHRGRHGERGLPWIFGLTALFCLFAPAPGGECRARAQESDLPAEYKMPSRHFQVDSPAELSDATALTVYLRVLDEMTAGYRLSGDGHAGAYRTWRRYNKTPYRSATHGQRFVNNYANTAAKAYGRYEAAGEMPAGAVLAKDSFAVTERGDVFLGPLFLMEKMPEGFNAKSADWRYTMIMPDGSLFGSTDGEGAQRVEFCITCHRSVAADNDHLFFVPEKQRVRIYSLEPQGQ